VFDVFGGSEVVGRLKPGDLIGRVGFAVDGCILVVEGDGVFQVDGRGDVLVCEACTTQQGDCESDEPSPHDTVDSTTGRTVVSSAVRREAIGAQG
jgi:hypothetical protein